jgi:pyroglutamyl-peptidase
MASDFLLLAVVRETLSRFGTWPDHFCVSQTKAPVDQLIEALRKQGFDCAPSIDAGRFVCNFVYYHSLRHSSAHGTEALFVHVPAFDVVGEEVQLDFVVALLRTLASLEQ